MSSQGFISKSPAAPEQDLEDFLMAKVTSHGLEYNAKEFVLKVQPPGLRFGVSFIIHPVGHPDKACEMTVRGDTLFRTSPESRFEGFSSCEYGADSSPDPNARLGRSGDGAYSHKG